MIFSTEQTKIIELCNSNNNVIVDAVAGSGKTTTLLGIAGSNQQILAVLYNKSLKEDTRQRANVLGLGLLEIHTYHALARKYYDNTITTDNGIISILKSNKAPIKSIPRFNRIIVDEVQDMSPLYFKLLKKLIHDIKNPELRIIIMGDRFQSIYSYMGADSRFLTLADKIYKTVDGPWSSVKLSTTFRCSPSICSFINEGLLGYDRMIPTDKNKISSPVRYIHGSPFDAHKLLLHYITTFIQQGFKPDDFFVLTTSVKVKGRDTPTRVLENALVAVHIPVYVPNDETSELTESSTNGKLVITTFHQSKGLERDIVIVYNFDNSYYYNKEFDNNFLASPLYVGITRARKHLFVVHDSKQPALPFYKHPKSKCVNYLTTYGTSLDILPNYNNHNREKKPPSHVFLASDITNYLTAQALLEADAFLSVDIIKEPDIKVPLTTSIQTSSTTKESVADLNGIAIPALYEWRHNKSMRIALVDDHTVLLKGNIYSERYYQLQKKICDIKEPAMDIILEIANIFSSMFTGYHYKVAQIKSYNWLKTSMVEPCLEILEKNIISRDTEYEKQLPEQVFNGACVRGQVDAYSENLSKLWEIKCTDTLDLTHNIQLGVYAWMFSKAYPEKFKEVDFHLINIRTGELRRIRASKENLDFMMAYLILEKTRPIPKISDVDFIKEFSTKFESSFRQLTLTNMLGLEKNKKEALKEPDILEKAMEVEVEQKVGRVIVFDLETNGLPDCPKFGAFYPPTDIDKYRTARIVQWSWALYETDGTLLKEEDHFIKPNTSEYRILNHEIHGITETIAKEKGKSFEEVLALWRPYAVEATTIVGHNVNFDKNVLFSEFHRRGFSTDVNTLEKKDWLCTMERGTLLCGLKARNKLKPPKLRELMHALNIKEEPNRPFHNSKHDVYYTAKCYFAEQIVKNPCPKMYDGKYNGLTYQEIFVLDRDYAINAAAVCNVRKLYNSPLRKLSNWVKEISKTDDVLKAEILQKEEVIRNMTS